MTYPEPIYKTTINVDQLDIGKNGTIGSHDERMQAATTACYDFLRSHTFMYPGHSNGKIGLHIDQLVHHADHPNGIHLLVEQWRKWDPEYRREYEGQQIIPSWATLPDNLRISLFSFSTEVEELQNELERLTIKAAKEVQITPRTMYDIVRDNMLDYDADKPFNPPENFFDIKIPIPKKVHLEERYKK